MENEKRRIWNRLLKEMDQGQIDETLFGPQFVIEEFSGSEKIREEVKTV